MSSTLTRIVQMDSLIRSGLYPSVSDFATRFEVSRRTVYADTDPTWVLPSVIATEGELLAFFLSAELTRRYLGTSFEQPLRSAIAKLAGHLPERMQLDLGQLTQHFTFQAGATVGSDPVLLLA